MNEESGAHTSVGGGPALMPIDAAIMLAHQAIKGTIAALTCVALIASKSKYSKSELIDDINGVVAELTAYLPPESGPTGSGG